MNRSITNRVLIVVSIICATLMAVSGEYGIMTLNLMGAGLLTYAEANS